MKTRITIPAAALLAITLSGAALADHGDAVDVAVGGGIGGALGAVIGNELGGRDGAVIGGAVGGATGVAIASDGRRHHRNDGFVRDHRHRGDRRFRDHGPRHGRGHGAGFCPPGLAMQGRC